MYARPQGTQYWQFTQDYALARVRDGVVQPTARFWLMKHFTDLTPHGGDAVTAASDQKSVLVTAFRKNAAYTVHILNTGAARMANVDGLPRGEWLLTETTESAQYQSRAPVRSEGNGLAISLPSRSLVTLTMQATAPSAE